VGAKVNLVNQHIGRLTVLYDTGLRGSNGSIVWHCKCDCGNEIDVRSDSLRTGNTASCGCYHRDQVTSHGFCAGGFIHPIHEAWHSMIQRCENPNNINYHNYGARGIAVCLEWHDPQMFIKWALANGWEKGLTLDRINNNGNYEPNNCRWTTAKVQARNRRNNVWVEWHGGQRLACELAEEHNKPIGLILDRLARGWPIGEALNG